MVTFHPCCSLMTGTLTRVLTSMNAGLEHVNLMLVQTLKWTLKETHLSSPSSRSLSLSLSLSRVPLQRHQHDRREVRGRRRRGRLHPCTLLYRLLFTSACSWLPCMSPHCPVLKLKRLFFGGGVGRCVWNCFALCPFAAAAVGKELVVSFKVEWCLLLSSLYFFVFLWFCFSLVCGAEEVFSLWIS